MITVAILINGHPIMARSAVNIGKLSNHPNTSKYRVDDGTLLLHKPKTGAVELAVKMLKTIKEEK